MYAPAAAAIILPSTLVVFCPFPDQAAQPRQWRLIVSVFHLTLEALGLFASDE